MTLYLSEVYMVAMAAERRGCKYLGLVLGGSKLVTSHQCWTVAVRKLEKEIKREQRAEGPVQPAR